MMQGGRDCCEGREGQKGLDLGAPGLREPASPCDYRQNHSCKNIVSKLKGKRCREAGSWTGVALGCTGHDEGIMQALCAEEEQSPAVAPGFQAGRTGTEEENLTPGDVWLRESAGEEERKNLLLETYMVEEGCERQREKTERAGVREREMERQRAERERKGRGKEGETEGAQAG